MILPLLKVRHSSKISLYVNSEKTKELNLREQQKNLVSGPILAHLAKIRIVKSFSQKSGFVSDYISWSPIIMSNIRKN